MSQNHKLGEGLGLSPDEQRELDDAVAKWGKSVIEELSQSELRQMIARGLDFRRRLAAQSSAERQEMTALATEALHLPPLPDKP